MARPKKGQVSLWFNILKYVIQQGKGETFTRKELIKYLFDWNMATVCNSIDIYLVYLKKAGYLITKSKGVYQIIKVPEIEIEIKNCMG